MAYFAKNLKVPSERIGVLLGKRGEIKGRIEEECRVTMLVDSRSGEVKVEATGDMTAASPLKAVELVMAIARGFSPERAFRLLEEGAELRIVDLREYGGKSPYDLIRIKGRVIGEGGRARRVIEELTGAYISVYGHTVAVIGDGDWASLAEEAVRRLASGSPHTPVYSMLQKARSKAKMEKRKLWEEAPYA